MKLNAFDDITKNFPDGRSKQGQDNDDNNSNKDKN